MTGAIGHVMAFVHYWQARDRGVSKEEAMRQAAQEIRQASDDWLSVSKPEFESLLPVNFGRELMAEIARETGVDPRQRFEVASAGIGTNHDLPVLDPDVWRSIVPTPGKQLVIADLIPTAGAPA
jgi:hypothetical protein